jgi:hypothetical protein
MPLELPPTPLELLPALEPELLRDSQSVLAMPVSPVHWLELPAVELLLGVLLVDEPVLGVVVLGLVVLGLAVLGLVALPEEPLPIEPLELPDVCATETPATPRKAAATAAQRSLLVIFAP